MELRDLKKLIKNIKIKIIHHLHRNCSCLHLFEGLTLQRHQMSLKTNATVTAKVTKNI